MESKNKVARQSATLELIEVVDVAAFEVPIKEGTGAVAIEEAGVVETAFVESPAGLCWRLSHDGVRVLDLHEGTGLTWAPALFCATTREECEAEIERLGLERPAALSEVG